MEESVSEAQLGNTKTGALLNQMEQSILAQAFGEFVSDEFIRTGNKEFVNQVWQFFYKLGITDDIVIIKSVAFLFLMKYYGDWNNISRSFGGRFNFQNWK